MPSFLVLAANLFPVWVLLGAVTALFYPAAFTWFDRTWITVGLAVIMLGMGITLSVDDFKKVLRMPKAVGCGFAAQYLIMPFLGWWVAQLYRLDPPLAVGLILVSCCPGGTASNVVTYIARANIALSVLMTMCSTMAAVVMTPLLTSWLAGAYVPVDGWGMFWSTVQVVLLPMLVGLFCHHRFPALTRWVSPAGPLVSVVLITLICASIVGQNRMAILENGVLILSAVATLHSAGFFLGYLFARIFRYDVIVARTVSIEVGMQNSGLGATLARAHFTAEPLAAVPSAISSVCHSVIGSLLAGIWRNRLPRSDR